VTVRSRRVFSSTVIDAAPAGSRMVVVGSGLLALFISLVVWPVVGFAVTVAHEGGHAITGSMMGGTVHSIRLGRGATGVTRILGGGLLGSFLTGLSGYLGPSLFGLLGAVLLTGGHDLAVLWLSLVFLLLALLQMRNILGAVATVATGALIVLVLKYAPPHGRTFFAYTWIWFLLFGGFGHVATPGRTTSADAAGLKKLTFLPATVWDGFFWLATLAGLAYGGGILLGLVQFGRH